MLSIRMHPHPTALYDIAAPQGMVVAVECRATAAVVPPSSSCGHRIVARLIDGVEGAKLFRALTWRRTPELKCVSSIHGARHFSVVGIRYHVFCWFLLELETVEVSHVPISTWS